MADLVRCNVQSKFVGGRVSWEFQADPKGQWVEAASALDRIRDLEEQLAHANDHTRDSSTASVDTLKAQIVNTPAGKNN